MVSAELVSQYVQLSLCVVVLVVNVLVTVRNNIGRLDISQHLNMCHLKLYLENVYAVAVLLYSSCRLIDLLDMERVDDFIYVFGNVMSSLQASMALLYLFLTMDRYFAMKRPIVYSQYYSSYIKRSAVTLGTLVLLLAFFIYAVTKNAVIPVMEHPAFAAISDSGFFNFLRIAKLICYAASIGFMVNCRLRYARFIKKKRAKFMGSFVDNVKSANRVVYLLTFFMIILIFIPLAGQLCPTSWGIILQQHENCGYMMFAVLSSAVFMCSTTTYTCKTRPQINYI
ncbi:hypothetical protein L596_026070 [Steinernema carpocapsae]|uniref:G-protein coupled receptors family 1 profile domain-containing protein n=1 Tax=Steinernema carpocapsae TaxID=34508 RepID=A0A4U5M193_STECR|nr:hypothetical protein L596_026070 [Steinernema carpocapsae]